MHLWVPTGADGLASGFGEAVVAAVPEDGAAGVPDDGVPDDGVDGGPDGGPGGGPDGGADVLGWAGGLGASCRQAAMTTRLPAGSALPPTPLRSTK